MISEIMRVRRPNRANMRFRAAAIAAAVSFALPIPLGAQDFTFQNVAVEGNTRVDDATILGLAGIARGQSVTAGQLNDAAQAIRASGLFENVDVIPQGGTLIISVDENPIIGQISIEGNRRLSDEELLALVGSQARRVYSPTQAERDARTIAQAYQARGRLAATVDPRIIRRENDVVDLVFEITEGRVVENERISFVGNRAYSDARLRRVLQTKQAGFLRQVIQSDTFIADRLAFDRRALSDFYMSRGYVDFQILDIDSSLTRERDATLITVTLQEGQRYRFGEIRTVSEVPGIDPADFRAVASVRPGQTYSPQAVDNTVARMERLATQRGLDFVRVDPRIDRDNPNLELDLTFALVRGPRVFVERIDIEGNSTTLDRVIRRQFRTVEGDPFNPREIRAASDRIRALNYFANVDVESRTGSAPDRVIIDVDVEEEPTGTLSFGGSYSGDTGFGVALSFSERNFLGRGQTLRFDVNTSDDAQTASLQFYEPAILSRDLGFRLTGGYRETNFSNVDYNTRTISLSPAVDFPVSENGRLTLRYRIASEELSDLEEPAAVPLVCFDDPDALPACDGVDLDFSSAILREEEGEEIVSSLGYTYTYDTRRTGLNPNAGIRFRFSQDFAGLGGDAEYVSTEAALTGQADVLNEEVTLRATLEGGYIGALNDGETRVTDRFFFSSREFRGFESRGIGPRDLNAPNEDPLGGNAYAVARFEAEFPLGLPEEYGITGGAFLDVGSLWDLDDNDGGIDGDDGLELVDDEAALRSALGLSVFWDTAIGPLRLNFSRAIAKEDFDREQDFDFTIATQF